MTVWKNRMFRGYLAGRPYLRDICETQLSPSCSNSSHSNHVQGTCIISRDAYSRATRKNTSVFNTLSLHTLSFSHTQTLTNKSHMKYRVHKIEHNYNQIWHGIKANKTHSCKLQLYKRNSYHEYGDKIDRTKRRHDNKENTVAKRIRTGS